MSDLDVHSPMRALNSLLNELGARERIADARPGARWLGAKWSSPWVDQTTGCVDRIELLAAIGENEFVLSTVPGDAFRDAQSGGHALEAFVELLLGAVVDLAKRVREDGDDAG